MMTRLLSGLFLLSALLLAPAASASADAECGPDDAVLVVEPGSLEGDDSIHCIDVTDDLTGLDALAAAGLDYEETTAASMPMLCRIDGQPTPQQEKCGNELSGDGYWAFMVAEEGQDWGYAQTGLRDHEVEPGQFLALRYHLMADGENVPVEADASAETRAQASVAPDDSGATTDAEQSDDEDSGFPVTTVVVLVVLVVLIGLLVVVSRRRRS